MWRAKPHPVLISLFHLGNFWPLSLSIFPQELATSFWLISVDNDINSLGLAFNKGCWKIQISSDPKDWVYKKIIYFNCKWEVNISIYFNWSSYPEILKSYQLIFSQFVNKLFFFLCGLFLKIYVFKTLTCNMLAFGTYSQP